jgi:hypothetical protein
VPLDVPATNDAETDYKVAKQGFAILDLAETLVKLPRLDSNQQPFGLSDLLCVSDR